jgi:hypothetical protein
MSKDQLRKFIRDTRGLIRDASPEQKIKLLKLIKEAKQKCDAAELDEMQLDEKKVDEALGSKFATAALAGALAASGAKTMNDHRITPKLNKSVDYLEEK